MHFGKWNDTVHSSSMQSARQEKALREHMEVKQIDKINCTAIIENMSGTKTYSVGLDSCTCPDFVDRQLPCKHIYKLYYTLYGSDCSSSKVNKVLLVSCILGGWFGLHYFESKRVGMGLLYLFTFGLFCFGWFYDIYRIACNKFYAKSKSGSVGQPFRTSDLGNGVTASWHKNF